MQARLGPLRELATKLFVNFTVYEFHAIGGYAVKVGRMHIGVVITAHHLSRMVIGHDVDYVVPGIGFLFLAARSEGNEYGRTGQSPDHVNFCHIFLMM